MDLAAVRLEAAGGELQHEAIYAIPANVSIWYVVEAPPNHVCAYAEFPDDEAAALAFCSAVNYRRERLGESARVAVRVVHYKAHSSEILTKPSDSNRPSTEPSTGDGTEN